MSKISTASVRRFVLGQDGRSAGSIGVIGGAIGCYFRFRTLSGDRVSELAAGIPRAAHWRLASLPGVLTDTEIAELLRSFDEPFPSHRRAYAMTQCLIDLGLRCSDVVGLRLENIDWADGTISLGGAWRPGRRAFTICATPSSAVASSFGMSTPPISATPGRTVTSPPGSTCITWNENGKAGLLKPRAILKLLSSGFAESGCRTEKYRIILNTGFFFVERPRFLNDDALLHTTALGLVGDLV